MEEKKLGIIHTSKATIDSLAGLANDLMPGVKLMNILDDTILPQLAEQAGDIEVVAQRWLFYARTAYELGAHCIVSACSSVGELAERAGGMIPIPVLRIDDAMAHEAVQIATSIGIIGTLQTTMGPTARLVKRKALEQGHDIRIDTMVVSSAYERLMAGDTKGHDEAVALAIEDMAKRMDMVLLAQASMARVTSQLPQDMQHRITSSPRLGMTQVARVMKSL